MIVQLANYGQKINNRSSLWFINSWGKLIKCPSLALFYNRNKCMKIVENSFWSFNNERSCSTSECQIGIIGLLLFNNSFYAGNRTLWHEPEETWNSEPKNPFKNNQQSIYNCFYSIRCLLIFSPMRTKTAF